MNRKLHPDGSFTYDYTIHLNDITFFIVFSYNQILYEEKDIALSFFIGYALFRDRADRSRCARARFRRRRSRAFSGEAAEPFHMPTILRSRTIHQPDRSQTSKKLADSSKPIATPCSLTVVYVRSFQITRASRPVPKARVPSPAAFFSSRVYALYARMHARVVALGRRTRWLIRGRERMINAGSRVS